MSVYKVKDKRMISAFFDGWQETMIWSCLQDCMGDAYADDPACPRSAQIIVGDICFLAGAANEELVRNRRSYSQHDFIIMVPQTEQWASVIEAVFQEKAHRWTRYATKKDPDLFDRARLQSLAAQLPDGYELRLMDGQLYELALSMPWSQDLCGNFADYADYRDNGLGVALLKDGALLSGASSYTYYRGGIEVEIDTRKEERRKGFATICGAKLILECLERGLYPSWDAHNEESLALAEKLGYQLDKAYLSYEIHGM